MSSSEELACIILFSMPRSTNSQFVEVLKHLEASPVAQNLQFVSFLILPVQRITRFALLVLVGL